MNETAGTFPRPQAPTIPLCALQAMKLSSSPFLFPLEKKLESLDEIC